MWSWIWFVVAALAAVGIGLFVALVMTMRMKYRPGLSAVRRMNRRFTNPRVLRSAGRQDTSASVINHVGRTSGTAYSTPIGVIEAGEQFVVVLPYGPDADWVRNVVAAGRASLDHGGERYELSRPQIVDRAAVDRFLSRRERMINRVFGTVDYLLVTGVSQSAPAGADPR